MKHSRSTTKPVSRLFAIYDSANGYYWMCDSEHGAGWCDQIRQAWSRRAALKEVAALVQRGWARLDDLCLVHLKPQDGAS